MARTISARGRSAHRVRSASSHTETVVSAAGGRTETVVGQVEPPAPPVVTPPPPPPPPPPTGPTVTVTATPATFNAVWLALTSAGGHVLGLSAGSYPSPPARTTPFASEVIVTSLDPDNKAAFPAGITLRNANASFVTLDGLDLTLAAPTGESQPCVYVLNGSDITIRNNVMGGQVVSGKRWGYGVNAVGTTRLTISGNVCTTLKRGFTVQTIVDGSITLNDVFDLRVDGIDIGLGCRGLLVSGNHIRSGDSIGGDHPDGIQFISSLAAAAEDVLVENNLIEGSVSNRPQGVFGGGRTGGARPKRISVQENLLISTSYTGIGLVNTDNLAISDNVLLFVKAADPLAKPNYSSVHTYPGSTVTASGNQATKLLLDASTTASGNTVIPASTQGEADAAVAAWRVANR